MRSLQVYGMRDSLRYTLIRGPVGKWLRTKGIPALWTPRLRGWCVRTDRIGDVIALAEFDGFRVHMRGELNGR